MGTHSGHPGAYILGSSGAAGWPLPVTSRDSTPPGPHRGEASEGLGPQTCQVGSGMVVAQGRAVLEPPDRRGLVLLFHSGEGALTAARLLRHRGHRDPARLQLFQALGAPAFPPLAPCSESVNQRKKSLVWHLSEPRRPLQD